ncbi:MAG: ECF transporter S component [Bacillota bacterium]|jgi:riboflavin transporter FmnP|nr:ECF transporter S component [Bacillota bacterium]HHU29274.1 ECF transporter S component [Bacillota bacterium]
MTNTEKVKKPVLAGFFIALGLLLPFLTGQLQSLGNALLPMHIPVLIAGFILGAPSGLIIGFILPVLRSALFGMPPIFPVAVSMSFELAAYGFFTGLFHRLLPKRRLSIYISLIASMIIGRIVWGTVRWILLHLAEVPLTWEFFVTEAFVKAVPGIILQIILIPIIVAVVEHRKA